MLRIRPAVRLACFGLPFRKALIRAAELGAEAVEIDARRELQLGEMSQTAIRQINKLLDDQGLRISALSFNTRRGYNVMADLDRRVAATQQAMLLASNLGCNVITNRIGVVPEDQEDPSFTALQQILVDLGEYGQRVGTSLAARTGSEDGEVLAALLATLPVGYGAVDLDPGSLVMNGYSATESTQILAPYVVHMRIRDGLRDIARGQGAAAAFGAGAVDFDQLFALLEEQHFAGYFTIDPESSRNVVGEVAAALQRLHAI